MCPAYVHSSLCFLDRIRKSYKRTISKQSISCPKMKFTASRLSDGNNFFPDQIIIDNHFVTITSPKLFGGASKSFPIEQITISIIRPMIGFSDITVYAHGTQMTGHGFSSSEAKKIKKLI